MFVMDFQQINKMKSLFTEKIKEHNHRTGDHCARCLEYKTHIYLLNSLACSTNYKFDVKQIPARLRRV